MTNIQTIDLAAKGREIPPPSFLHYVKIEVYFRDGAKELYEFENSIDYMPMIEERLRYCATCYRDMLSSVDNNQIALHWTKECVQKPSGEITHLETLPDIHLSRDKIISAFI